MKVINIDWFVTGYHVFKRKPADNEKLKMYAEKKNPVDPWAVLVKDVKGNTIGRVPANLCRAFRKLKESSLASNFECIYQNEVIRVPNYERSFKRKIGAMDSPGGGAVLKCNYSFTYEEKDFERVANMVKDNVPGTEMYRFS